MNRATFTRACGRVLGAAILTPSVEQGGEKGTPMLPEVLRTPRSIFIPIFAGLLVGVLFALEQFADP